MSSGPSSLEIISSNTFVGFPDGKILSWCPTMDLLAVSMNKTSIWVFRLNGERVFSINNRAEILDLRWNHSGKFFVVSGADSLMKVYDSNNGKLINLLPTSSGLPITLSSWSFMDVERSTSGKAQLDDQFQEFFKFDLLKFMPKLSNEVASVSPENGTTVNHNSNPQTMSESVTNTNESENLLDCLLVVNANALLSMTFNNLFTVSDIELPEDCKYLQHATPESLFSQFFLVSNSSGQLQLREMKLQVDDSLKRRHLLEVIEWSSQLVSIINHVRDQLSLIVAEAEAYLKILDRHLGNLKDVLYEDVDLTTNFPHPSAVEDKIVETLIDILLTGLVPRNLKDYWLNQFGERGLIKVSALGNNAYDNSRKILFSQIILALEKIIILLSNLEGVAAAETSYRLKSLGISADSVKSAIKESQTLAKDLYSFIWQVNAEQESFNKFLNWAKIEIIEKLSKEDNDAELFFNAHPTMEFKASDIMEFLEEKLFDSALLRYLNIDDGDLETIKRKSGEETSLQKRLDKLHTELNNNLLNGVQQFIVEKVKIAEPLTLDLEPNQSNWDINLFNSEIYVTSTKNDLLTVLHVERETQTKREIQLRGEILCHEFINVHHILILYKDGVTYKLELISIVNVEPHVIGSITFDENTFVKRPSLMTVNGLEDPSHIIGCVLDQTKKEYVVFKVNS